MPPFPTSASVNLNFSTSHCNRRLEKSKETPPEKICHKSLPVTSRRKLSIIYSQTFSSATGCRYTLRYGAAAQQIVTRAFFFYYFYSSFSSKLRYLCLNLRQISKGSGAQICTKYMNTSTKYILLFCIVIYCSNFSPPIFKKKENLLKIDAGYFKCIMNDELLLLFLFFSRHFMPTTLETK